MAKADNIQPGLAVDLDLPPIETRRWTARRKALIVSAVRAGIIGSEEVCRRYHLSAEELVEWQRATEAHGIGALRVTRPQVYRPRI
jgi:Protein of unknown function (DUF1153)